MFNSDGRVLYLSLHRHDGGNYYPFTGALEECGEGAGLGLTVNIPWQASAPRHHGTAPMRECALSRGAP